MTVDLQTIIEILFFLGAIIGVYVKLNTQVVLISAKLDNVVQQLEQERTERKEDGKRLLLENHADRKVFESHSKETGQAISELNKTMHGIQVFLEKVLKDPASRKKGSDS